MPKINIRLWKRQPRFIMKIKVLNNPDGHLYMWTDRTERNIFENLKNEWWRSWIVISDGLGTSWLTRHSGRYMYRPMQTGNHKDGNAEFSKVHHRECSHCEIMWCYWTKFFCNFIGCFYDYPLDTHLGMFLIFEKCERKQYYATLCYTYFTAYKSFIHTLKNTSNTRTRTLLQAGYIWWF